MTTSTAEDSVLDDAGAVPDDTEPDGTSTAIPMLRGQIDALDTAITRLVAERARLSRRIQTARMNAGGTRVELGRERVVLDTYRNSLGADGLQLGDAVLRVCRGAR
ncbi:MAG TPA: chorismate mutase [Jatrophihabitantaceae bacterium]|nr:chorismate mutase [Jatrophihabitantaceae bacterium]HYU67393.1 chorismate mutase [Jatrophihabitantaceae bacterium]